MSIHTLFEEKRTKANPRGNRCACAKEEGGKEDEDW